MQEPPTNSTTTTQRSTSTGGAVPASESATRTNQNDAAVLIAASDTMAATRTKETEKGAPGESLPSKKNCRHVAQDEILSSVEISDSTTHNHGVSLLSASAVTVGAHSSCATTSRTNQVAAVAAVAIRRSKKGLRRDAYNHHASLPGATSSSGLTTFRGLKKNSAPNSTKQQQQQQQCDRNPTLPSTTSTAAGMPILRGLKMNSVPQKERSGMNAPQADRSEVVPNHTAAASSLLWDEKRNVFYPKCHGGNSINKDDVNRNSTGRNGKTGVSIQEDLESGTPPELDPPHLDSDVDMSQRNLIEDTQMVPQELVDTSLNDLPMDQEAVVEGPLEAVALVEARQVIETSHRNLVAADPVDLEEEERKAQQKRQAAHRRMFSYASASGLIIISLLVGLFVSRSGKQSDHALLLTQAPTGFLFTPQSIAPSGQMGDFLSSLPNETQVRVTTYNTPQYKAFEWLSSHPNITNMEGWKRTQLFALATMFHAMEGPWWPALIKNDWLDYNKDECYWWSAEYGSVVGQVYTPERQLNLTPCNTDGRFYNLGLSGLELAGFNAFIPQEIALLTSLEVIAVISSEINASLSDWLPLKAFQYMKNLTALYLNANNFYGTIPTKLGCLRTLEYVTMWENHLSGGIPSELGLLSQTIEMSFFSNALTGTIPSELGQLSRSTLLEVGSNALTGTIPSELGQLSLSTWLDLGYNLLSGAPPSELGMLHTVEWFWLDNNVLSGTIPTQLGQLASMRRIWLFQNKLTGQVPSELGQLPNIEALVFQRNALSGTIPSEFGRLRTLAFLNANSNALTGTIPTELGLLTILQLFFCNSNELTGQIPTELGLLSSYMAWLELQNNSLSGTVPQELSALQQSLHTFRLGGNLNLSGTIPEALCGVNRTCTSSSDVSCPETGGLTFDCWLLLCGCDSCSCAASNGGNLTV